MSTITLKCDRHGCKDSVSLVTPSLERARARAAAIKGWTTSERLNITFDWCEKHPNGQDLNVGLEDL